MRGCDGEIPTSCLPIRFEGRPIDGLEGGSSVRRFLEEGHAVARAPIASSACAICSSY